MNYQYFDRDISWLSFNERLLQEAAREQLPEWERLNFLSIYSSNLDEFYRVRMPALMVLQKLKKQKNKKLLQAVTEKIQEQQQRFGSILTEQIIPRLKNKSVYFIYNEPIPEAIGPAISDYFFNQVAAFLQPVILSGKAGAFFPENNSLYLVITLQNETQEKTALLSIPSLPRLYSIRDAHWQYVIFLDDIIREHLHYVFPGFRINGAYSIKITRDAELNLQDEFEGDIAEKIEKQLGGRDAGLATRFLFAPDMPASLRQTLVDSLGLSSASLVGGGRYHHLRDLAGMPLNDPSMRYAPRPAIPKAISFPQSLLASITAGDIMVHTPYQDYGLILRFFNEAVIDPAVTAIYITLYRIAGDSRIATALISAARNGKKITVFVELKARFDEANNIRWAKKMKEAGIQIIYSIPGLKVHAKVALLKRKLQDRVQYYGLLSTGNFNESTARFYTDHILLTAQKDMLRELELLFIYLAKRKKPDDKKLIPFRHMLVAQFNLQDRFYELINREIEHARQGLPASITIKLNNLEEQGLIDKLYEASAAGVKIRLLVRGICRLMPGISRQSENIAVKRIVDRYLEHGRLFLFHNNGVEELYAGSADWMERNIFRRIEVCFPIYDNTIRKQLITLMQLQWDDNTQAVWIDETLSNTPVRTEGPPVESQKAIYDFLNN